MSEKTETEKVAWKEGFNKGWDVGWESGQEAAIEDMHQWLNDRLDEKEWLERRRKDEQEKAQDA